MKVLKIRAYDYNELNEAGKTAVRIWLDEAPIEVENDKGEFEFRYFSDMTDIEIDEHCQANGYLFTESGRPIHHLEREVA
jgi:hypothetical protein